MSLRVSTPKAFISACSGLMYSKVPTKAPNCVNIVFSVSRCSTALATPKSITLGTGLIVVHRHQDVGRLDVAVDDPLLMCVLDGLAHGHEQFQPLARVQFAVVAKLGNGHAVDQLHDEVGPAAVGRADVEDAGDVLVVHHGQGLPLGLEAGDDLAAVHPRLDDLQRDAAADRLELLGHEDGAHAPFADLLEELVGADDCAEALRGRLVDGRAGSGRHWTVEQAVGAVAGGQQLASMWAIRASSLPHASRTASRRRSGSRISRAAWKIASLSGGDAVMGASGAGRGARPEYNARNRGRTRNCVASD